MELQISGKPYEVSPAFLTLYRYRARYGTSFLAGKEPTFQQLFQLIYEGIKGPKPGRNKLEREAAQDPGFPAQAYSIFCEMTKSARRRWEGGPAAAPVDEYQIMALFAQSSLPAFLLSELTIFQLLEQLEACFGQGAAPAPREMSSQERKALYSITPEREAQVEAYLARQEG